MRIIKVNNCFECPYVTEAMTCELTGNDMEEEIYYSRVLKNCPLDEMLNIIKVWNMTIRKGSKVNMNMRLRGFKYPL